MTKREAALGFFQGELLGVLVEEEELIELGGQSLANAFDNHHVQLARLPSGQYQIVEDVYADNYWLVDGVAIEEHRTARGQVGASWELCPEQSEEVRAELADFEDLETAPTA